MSRLKPLTLSIKNLSLKISQRLSLAINQPYR
jgi:hypothetical protein